MAETVKVAIVTGSNRGIGNAIVKALSKSFEGVVYLTCNIIFITSWIVCFLLFSIDK